MLRFVVDWDGTCTEDSWPKMGAWLPGAIDALRHLCRLGHVCIDSCRVNPYEHGYDGVRLRPPHITAAAIAEVRAMLDAEGLFEVEIHTTPGKPPGDVYIDNKGMTYHGRPKSWEKLIEIIDMKFEKEAASAR